MVVPLAHGEPIHDGFATKTDADGVVIYEIPMRLKLRGSWETGVNVRTSTRTAERCTHVIIDGNPVKHFQGHNLWGTDDLHRLTVATCWEVARVLGLEPTRSDVDAWNAGEIELLMVDQNMSFHVGQTRGDCLAWVRAGEQTAHLKYKGRGELTKGTTLYFGKHSRRSSLKIYSKGQEIAAKPQEQPAIMDLPSARAWAENALRCELRLHSLELKRLGLNTVKAWEEREQSVYTETDGIPAHPKHMLPYLLGNMTMTTTSALSAEAMDGLRPALRTAVQSWEAGNDLRHTLPRRTFYKYRAELLPHGIDIVMVNPKQGTNVVPLMRILEATPARIPDWAYGTPLYFEPPAVKVA
jgi:II/X family phage/plasmid replication protein